MSDDWLTFEAQITPMIWGKNTYTILHLPAEISAALTQLGAKRVEGELGDHPVNLALTKAPVIEGMFLYTGKSLLKAAGLTPGEIFDVRLRPADPNVVDTPDDVLVALRAAGRSADWQALTPGKQRGLLHGVETAKRAETRARRIATLIRDLGDGHDATI